MLTWLLKSLLNLPESIKLRLAGGEPVEKLGRVLDLDMQVICNNNRRGPQVDSMTPPKARAMFKKLTAITKGKIDPSIQVKEITISGQAGDRLKGRLYTPDKASKDSAALLYFHGGGVVIGDLDSYNTLCGDFCLEMNIPVIAVDYRLAPEHKFPIPAQDAFASYQWLRKEAAGLGINPDKIIVGGDSAGGYLSSVVSLQAIENDLNLPMAQILIYPMCDLRMAEESYQVFDKGFLLTGNIMRYFIGHYIRNEEDKLDPLASPALASDEALKQMPPTLLTLAGFDPLYDEGEKYYEKLKALGVKIELMKHDDLSHGFVTMTGALKRSKEAQEEIARYANEHFLA